MKKLIFSLLHRVGVIQSVAWWNRKKLMILCYHSVSVCPEHLMPDKHKQHIAADLFASHLEYLKRHYHPISLYEYLRIRSAGLSLPDKSVVLTFDDGFRNFLTVAAPLLVERSIPATVFIIIEKTLAREKTITERHWGQEWVPADDSSYLSWLEIQALAQEKHLSFGSHSYSHPRLTQIPLEEVERELRDSHKAMVQQMNYESMLLAFPHGETSDEISQISAALGYDCALTGTLGPNDVKTDMYKMRRTVIASDDDLPTFAARVSGLTWWAERFRVPFRRAASRLFGQGRPRSQSTVLEPTDS